MGNANIRSAKSSNFIDLYKLLGLEPFESDVMVIESAIATMKQRAEAKLKDEPQRAQRLTKIVELSRHHLLDRQRKALYDARWNEQACEDLYELEGFLPSGDPMAEFDLKAYVNGLSSDSGGDELSELLQALQSPGVTLQTQLVNRLPTNTLGGTLTDGGVGNSIVSAPSLKTAAMRRKRGQRRFLTQVLAGLVLCTTVLGAVYWFQSGASSNTPIASVTNNKKVSPSEANEVLKPRSGSGLPKVGGLDSNNSSWMTNPDQDEPIVDQVESTPADIAPAMDSNAEFPAESSPMLSMSEPTREPIDEQTDGLPDAMSETMMGMMPVETTPSVILSDAEKVEWKESMQRARAAISQFRFLEAQGELDAANKLAKSPLQKAQLERLRTIRELAAGFHSALVGQLEELVVGETFRVKSTDVSFVGFSDDRITIRMRGQNQSYPLTEIPVGLAFGIVDLKLDIASYNSLAKKAAFVVTHGASNSLVMAQARTMMAEAVAAGAVPADTVLIFEDDYTLLD